MTGARERALGGAVVLGTAAVVLYPLLVIALTAVSRSSSTGTGLLPLDGFTLGNFSRVWNAGFGASLASSAIVALVATAASVVVSILAGYAFGTMRFPGAGALFAAMLLGLVVPVEGIVVPLYFDLRRVALTDDYAGLILAEIGVSVAFGTFWMRTFFRSVPRSLIDGARVDGASSWSVLWRVLVPIGRPAVVTLAALVFVWTWNDFLLSLILLSGGAITTAPLRLATFVGPRSSDPTGLAAAALIVAVPPAVVFLALQRDFVRGMLTGALRQ
jgi:raffinose/stachyose/melibiose transport system permease protein